MVKILIGMNEQFFTSEQKQFCCKLVHRLWWAIFIAFVKLKILLWYYIAKTPNQSFVRLISYARSNVSKKLPHNYFSFHCEICRSFTLRPVKVVKFKCHIGWQIWKVPWRLWSIAYENSTDVYIAMERINYILTEKKFSWNTWSFPGQMYRRILDFPSS